MSVAYERSTTSMGTVVTIQLVGGLEEERPARVHRALSWFTRVEEACSRFHPSSELRQLSAQPVGTPVVASEILFEAVRFALAVARASDGAFDPTVGASMEQAGFSRRWETGEPTTSGIRPDGAVCWRDVTVDESARTITLHRPLLLDLGAVAKGLAVDLAAAELSDLADFAIDAGGDLYLAGCNAAGRPWSVGICHPRDPGALLTQLTVRDRAVCTSGDYERRSGDSANHHLLDPRLSETARQLASATVLSDRAMVADALATAAFVLGPERGVAFLERQGVDGLLVTPQLAWHQTAGFARLVEQHDVAHA